MSDYGIGLNGLKFNRNLLHGKGVRLIQEAEDGKLNPQVVPFHKQKGIHTLLKNSRHKKYFRESANDYEYFSINFPQVILTKNFELVNKIVRTDPSDCRFQVMNPATKRIEYCFLSSKWHEGVTHTHESVEALPVADPLMTAEEVKAWAKKHKIYKFILPVMDTMVGRKYYPFKAWHAIVGNGWLEVALAVPALKKALFQNQMSIKYHVEIPEGYWRAKYSVDKWTNYSNSEKDRLRGETLDRINEWLTGVENTGKALITFYDVDEMGNELPQVRITAIDDKMKDGAYIPDTQNANIEILGSMDIDPTLAGFGFAGSKLGAGSGSDKRTAFNLRTSMKTPDRDVVLEPFDFAFEYNGYDESLRLAFIDHQLTTLDENPTGKQSVTEG
ncbi:MAG: hypothetical protein ACPG5O_11455 [Pseudoalteromonas tetraodonis]